MSIITKSSVTKGTPSQFTLNKLNLLEHPIVQADLYFSNLSNWYRVNLIYKSTTGSQYEIVEFDASQATPTGTFLISEKARDEFQIQKVQIMDFDGGFLDIPRSELVVADLDVSLSSNVPVLLFQAFDTSVIYPNNLDNILSRSTLNETGQSFILNSPLLVKSVKVSIGRSSQALVGEMKLILKKSTYGGSGEEVLSSNSLNLSELLNWTTTSQDPELRKYEFVFDTPVLLSAGQNTIKFQSDNVFLDSSQSYIITFGAIPGSQFAGIGTYYFPPNGVDAVMWFALFG